MNESTHTPTFNMKVVVRETGLKPDTLRAWERRYGIPNPERTAGGHRLYSQYQIDMLKWMIERQSEGMSISHAIELWQQIKENGDDPLATDEAEPGPPAMPILDTSGDALTALRINWLNACLNFDEYQAQQILAQAFAQFPMELVCHEILQKNLNRIGQLWYEGEATIQQEHFCSGLAIRQLEALLASQARPIYDVTLVIACGPNEQHTFSPLFLTLLCRRRGWNVIYLGANVPALRLEDIVQTASPDLVLLSAQTLYTAGAMLEMAHMLQTLGVPMAYGGAVFSYLEQARRYVPGHYLGDDLFNVPERINQLVRSKPTLAHVESIPAGCQTAVSNYSRKRSAIEAGVEAAFSQGEMELRLLQNANHEFGNSIIAALQLGDIDLLTANINWLRGLLVSYHYRMPEEAMTAYIEAYYAAIKAELTNDEAGIILEWFDRLRKNNEVAQRMRGN